MSIFTLQNYLDLLKKQDMGSWLNSLPGLTEQLSNHEFSNLINSWDKDFEKQIEIIESIFSHESNLSKENLKRNVATIAKYSNTINLDVKRVIKSYLQMKQLMDNRDGAPPKNPNSQALSSNVIDK